MQIGFIGAGKVGIAFGIYLKQHGFEIYGYYSRTPASAREAAQLTGSKAEMELENVVTHSDILFITTNDDQIESVAQQLALNSWVRKQQVVVHMSGALSSQILEEVAKKGCYTYSFHPLQAFADISKAVEDLKDTVFTIEGDTEKIGILEQMLKTTGNTYFQLNAEQKTIYHAAACVISNYLVTLMDYGLILFESIGIDKQAGYKAMYPLIEGTIKNIHVLGTETALTGPIARGDKVTVKRHIEALKQNYPDTMKIYKLLGLKTLELAQKNKLSNAKAIKDLKEILES